MYSVCRPALLKFSLMPELSDQKVCELIPRSFTAAIPQANEVIRDQFFHSTKCQMQMSFVLFLCLFQTNLQSAISEICRIALLSPWRESDVHINDQTEREVSEMDFFSEHIFLILGHSCGTTARL